MSDEVLRDKIIFSDDVLEVTSPVRKCFAEDFGGLTHACGPIGGTGQWRVMVDEIWIEIAVDGSEIPVGEQGADEVLDKLFVRSSRHAVIVCRSRRRHHPPKVGCFLNRLGERIGVWKEAA